MIAALVERLDILQRHRMIRTIGHRASSGGRRAALLAVDDASRVAVVAGIGPSHATVALADLRGTILAMDGERLRPRHDPRDVLPSLVRKAKRLLAETGRRLDRAAHPARVARLAAAFGVRPVVRR